MTDWALIDELTAAARRKHVTFDDDDREFVRGLRGREELDAEERERARRLFRAEVDW